MFIINGAYQYRLLRTPMIFFYNGLRHHHIVVVNEKTAIDFTPIQQNDICTLCKLLLAMNVPARVRIRDAADMETILPSRVIDPHLVTIIEKWNKTEMNLYTQNCQHFSRFFIRELET
jgi:hypothetical protein